MSSLLQKFRSKKSNPIEVLVKFEGNNRRLTLPEDIKLEGLMEQFMRVFQDVLPPHVAPTQFLFQKFDPHYKEWVDMTEDEEIRDGEKIQVLLKCELPPGVFPHPIQDGVTYHIWSPVSRSYSSLMKRENTTMNCSGNLTDDKDLLNINAKDISTATMKLYRLELAVPNDPSQIYLVTGKGENQDVEAQKVSASSPPDSANTKFEPQYFYSYTLFRCKSVNEAAIDLYLASDQDGKLTLAKRGPKPEYPNPATLFICVTN